MSWDRAAEAVDSQFVRGLDELGGGQDLDVGLADLERELTDVLPGRVRGGLAGEPGRAVLRDGRGVEDRKAEGRRSVEGVVFLDGDRSVADLPFDIDGVPGIDAGEVDGRKDRRPGLGGPGQGNIDVLPGGEGLLVALKGQLDGRIQSQLGLVVRPVRAVGRGERGRKEEAARQERGQRGPCRLELHSSLLPGTMSMPKKAQSQYHTIGY